jgi:hypothetical protein
MILALLFIGDLMKEKFTIDFQHLDNRLGKPTKYKLADVQDRIEKVAYDLVRFRDNDDTPQLWKINKTDEGEVIVALYNEEDSLKAQSDWEAIPDKTAMQVFYKGEHITSLTESDMGIPAAEFGTVKSWLPKKLASDESLQSLCFLKCPVEVKFWYLKDSLNSLR